MINLLLEPFRYPFMVRGLVAAGLVAVDPQHAGAAFYRGRPLLVTENDHGIALYNGDVGLVWPDDDGVLRACFVAADGNVRRLPLARLPAHETCYAMTVHKSQGKTFDRVESAAASRAHTPMITAMPAAMKAAPVKYAHATCHGSHPGTSTAVCFR